jgi:hypothetical protein
MVRSMAARQVIRISKSGPLCPNAAQFVEVFAPWCYPEVLPRQSSPKGGDCHA